MRQDHDQEVSDVTASLLVFIVDEHRDEKRAQSKRMMHVI
jgi:hypothetical protein